ncbi:MAG TPA: hypothetical protein VH592_19885 [Gemmataceae bacterium]|jgi:hypothetical protein
MKRAAFLLLAAPFLAVFFTLSACHLVSLSSAEPPAPPPPETYDVRISYRINAFRNERLLQYREMMGYLKKVGFQRDPQEEVSETEPEEVAHTRMNGTVAGRSARNLLNERHIRSIQLIPHGAKLPEDKAARVRVEIELFDGLTPEEQYRLSRQTFEVLAGLSFFEAAAYDTRGYTRLVGSMPFSNVETLLTDLRQQPAGQKMPGPFKNVWAVRVSIVSPDVPPPAPRPRLPQVPPEQEKLSPDLREVLADAAAAAKPMRLEVILSGTPPADDKGFPRLLRAAAPGLVVEGRLGPLVTVVANPAQAPALAALPIVVGVRLPRLPQAFRPTANGDQTRWQPLLDASGAARLQAMGRTGRGTRLAVVDSDFRGWQGLIGQGTLPENTRLVDWTAERSVDLLPDPFPPGDGPGPGTRRALTIARLAPEINLTLIRIDPASPYMLEAVARAINGDDVPSINQDNRLAEIQADRDSLDKRRDQLVEERRDVLSTFPNPEEAQQRLLKEAEEKNLTPEQVEKLDAFQRMLERERAYVLYRVRQRIYNRDALGFGQRLERYFQQKQNIQSLRGIRVVASALSWPDGYPVDGSSALSRYFDDRPFRAALWFQAAGDTRGQSWSGFFRDADGNGVMEFADPRQPLPPDAWTPEVNFLSWQTPKGKTVQDIPAGTRLRISLQWSEAHDPLYAATGEDPYRQPLARNMRIFLLRQLDPTGKRQPADDMEIVAQSVDAGMRLSATANSAIYEVALDVRIKDAGRYAVQVGGIAPDSIYPPGDPTLPFMRKRSEMHVRVFVAPLDASGRAIFHDYVTAAGSLGMPADAQTAITVGAANLGNKRQPYSGGGAPFGLPLLAKPDMLAYDLGEGTAESTAFAAGLAALVPLAGRTPAACLQNFHIPPGGVLRLPDDSPDR